MQTDLANCSGLVHTATSDGDQCARAGPCRGSELNSTRALTLIRNSRAFSFVVHMCIHYKLFVCESEPAFIYKHHILVLVSIRQHKDIDIMRDIAVD